MNMPAGLPSTGHDPADMPDRHPVCRQNTGYGKKTTFYTKSGILTESCVQYRQVNRVIMEKCAERLTGKKGALMKTMQAFNPYLPSWEYVPDAEPHIVDGRVYIYGSHDLFNGLNFCLGDYVCWSAPVDDLGNWKYHGVIFKREQDPAAPRIRMTNGLAAPDMVVGDDGRYYLYYTAKSLVCQNQGISMNVMADGTLLDFMSIMDLSALFGNALDNAIRGAASVADENERLIRVVICEQMGFALVKIENRYAGEVRFDGKDLITTKNNKDYHGYGVKSIRRTVEKYDGTVTIRTEDGWFLLSILFPV